MTLQQRRGVDLDTVALRGRCGELDVGCQGTCQTVGDIEKGGE